MSVEVVVFDIGGVLVTEVPRASVSKWERRLGMAPGSLQPRLDPIWDAGSLGRIDLEEVHRRLDGVVGEGRAFMEDVWVDYLGTPRTALIEWFQRWPGRKAMLSNSFVGARERVEARYGFSSMCERIVYSHEEGVRKPDPEIYRRLCARLGVAAEGVVFVDDRAENRQAAEALGMTALRPELEALLAIDGMHDG